MHWLHKREGKITHLFLDLLDFLGRLALQVTFFQMQEEDTKPHPFFSFSFPLFSFLLIFATAFTTFATTFTAWKEQA